MISDTRLNHQSRFERETVVACVRTEQGSEEHKPPLSVSYVLVSEACKDDLYRAFPTWHLQDRLATCIAFSPEATDLLCSTSKGELREIEYGEYRVTFAVRLMGRAAVAIIKRVAPTGPKPIKRATGKTLALKMAKWGGLAMLFFAAYKLFPLALARLTSLLGAVRGKGTRPRKMHQVAYARDAMPDPIRFLGTACIESSIPIIDFDYIEIKTRVDLTELKESRKIVENLRAESGDVVGNRIDENRAAFDDSSLFLIDPPALSTKSCEDFGALLNDSGSSLDVAALVKLVQECSAVISRAYESLGLLHSPIGNDYYIVTMASGFKAARVSKRQPARRNSLLTRKSMPFLRQKLEVGVVVDRIRPANSNQSRSDQCEKSKVRLVGGRLVGWRSAVAMHSVSDRSSMEILTHGAARLMRVPLEPTANKSSRFDVVLIQSLSSHWCSLVAGWVSAKTVASTKCACFALGIKNILVRNVKVVQSVVPENKMEQLAGYEELLRLALEEIDAHIAGKKILYAYNVSAYRDAEFVASSNSEAQVLDVMLLH